MDLRLSQGRKMEMVYYSNQELYVRKKQRFMMLHKISKPIVRRNRFQLEKDLQAVSRSAYLTDIKRSKSLLKQLTKKFHQQSNLCKPKLKLLPIV